MSDPDYPTKASAYYFGICEDPDDEGYGVVAVAPVEFWDENEHLDDQLTDDAMENVEGWPEELECVAEATFSWDLDEQSVEDMKAALEAAGFRHNSALDDQYDDS